MLSAYKYRMYPSGVQEMRLKRSLHALCQLYDTFRAEKIRQHHLNHAVAATLMCFDVLLGKAALH